MDCKRRHPAAAADGDDVEQRMKLAKRPSEGV